MEWSSVSKPCEDVSPESGSALKRLVIQSNDRNFFIFFIKLLCARANVNEALRGLWLQKELLRRQLLHQPLLEGPRGQDMSSVENVFTP